MVLTTYLGFRVWDLHSQIATHSGKAYKTVSLQI